MRVINSEVNGKTYRRRDFRNINEAIDFAKKPLAQETVERWGSGVEQQAKPSFNGATYAQGMKNATLGWAKGWEISQKLATEFRIQVGDTSISKKTLPSYHGQSVSMGRYLMGDPRCMRNSVRKKLKKKGRIIKLFVHSGMLSNVSERQIKNRGACILALANSLEATGYRVEIESGFLARGDDGRLSDYRIAIKEAEQPIDQDRMGFIMVSPSMHRILGFRIREQEDLEWNKGFGAFSGQGATRDYSVFDELMLEMDAESDVYLGVNENEWEIFDHEASSKRWLRQQFDEFGIKTEDV